MLSRISSASATAFLVTGAILLALATTFALAGPAAAQPATPTPTPAASPATTLPQGGQGTLTATPATGLDVTAPTFVTSAGCPTTSNAFNIQVTGPNGLDYLVTGRTQAGFSTTEPFPANFVNSFKDAAALDTPPTTIVAGTYTATLNCVSGIVGQTINGTFTVDFIFDTPTTYTVSGVPSAPVTPTPNPGGGTPTPTPRPSTTATPAATATPTPTATATPSTTPTATPAPTATPVPTFAPTASPTPADTGSTGTGTGTGTGGTLAYTGAPVAELAAGGLALTLLGAGLLFAARRRSTG